MKYQFKPDSKVNETNVLITAQTKNHEVNEIERALEKIQKEEQTVTINAHQTVYRIHYNEIVFVDVWGDYTTIHLLDREFKVHQPLRKIEEQLQDECFVRGSRSLILNLDFVEKFRSSFSGTYLAEMANHQEVAISRRYWKKVKERVFQK